VAEDNPTNQKLVVTLLQHQGHNVTTVGDGRQAVAQATAEAFDVILMDVQMPEMGGFEATAAIREHERTTGTHTPIVAMTAHAMAGDRERCLAAGMDAYVSKPLRAEELIATVDRLVGPAPHVDTVPSSATTAGAPAADVATTAPPEAAGSLIDRDALLASVGGSESLLREVVGVFLEDTPKQIAALEAATRARDPKAVASAAHAIKGSAGLFSKAGAYESARRLEQAARQGDLTGVDVACDDLRRDAARLEEALRPLLVE
jgi:CheY-like chemotaxis protein